MSTERLPDRAVLIRVKGGNVYFGKAASDSRERQQRKTMELTSERGESFYGSSTSIQNRPLTGLIMPLILSGETVNDVGQSSRLGQNVNVGHANPGVQIKTHRVYTCLTFYAWSRDFVTQFIGYLKVPQILLYNSLVRLNQLAMASIAPEKKKPRIRDNLKRGDVVGKALPFQFPGGLLKYVVLAVNVGNAFFQVALPLILNSLDSVIQAKHDLALGITIFVVTLFQF